MIDSSLIEKLTSHGQEFKLTLTQRIINDLFDNGLVDNDHYLPYQAFFTGPTGYLDEIKSEHVRHAIMWGFDDTDRLYVTIHKLTYDDTGKFYGKGVETFFQRYSNRGDIWVSGTDCSDGYNYQIVHTKMETQHYEVLKNLIINGRSDTLNILKKNYRTQLVGLE